MPLGPHLRPFLDPLGEALGLSWASLGRSWADLGHSWAALGPLLGALGRSWGALGAVLGWSWALLGALGRCLGAPGRFRPTLGTLLDPFRPLLDSSWTLKRPNFPAFGGLHVLPDLLEDLLENLVEDVQAPLLSFALLALSSPQRAAAVRSTLNYITAVYETLSRN